MVTSCGYSTIDTGPNWGVGVGGASSPLQYPRGEARRSRGDVRPRRQRSVASVRESDRQPV